MGCQIITIDELCRTLVASVCRSGQVQFFDPKMGNQLLNVEMSKKLDCNQLFSVSVITSKNRLKSVS